MVDASSMRERQLKAALVHHGKVPALVRPKQDKATADRRGIWMDWNGTTV